MVKLTNKFYGASLIALAFSLNAANVNAQTCTTAPSCDTLGFTKSATDCEGHSILKCPFDQTKLYCDSGASSGDGGSSNCAVGDILYSDMTCSVELNSSKTAIGVVFNANRARAIGLGTASMLWSTEHFDVTGLPNLSDAKGDYSGASNTATVIAYCRNNNKDCPAFDYVANYSTKGTSIGDWYLPALGELKTIYDNKAVINATLGKIGSATELPDSYHWSSSEIYDGSAWNLGMNNGNVSYGIKNGNRLDVRPVLAF